MKWNLLHSRARDYLGYIPLFLDEADPRSATEQLDANYQHGGGWRPMDGWTYDWHHNSIKYPGDPELGAVAVTWLREEMVLVFPSGWVAVVQPDGATVEIARMD